MARDSSIIAENERGHRRGIVLGLTMAELMLLLLFCLMLVSVSALVRQQEQIGELEKSFEDTASARDVAALPQLRLDSTRLNKLLALLFPNGIPPLRKPAIDKLWRELALARTMRDALAEKGVNDTELVEVTEAAVAVVEATVGDADVAALTEVLERLVAAGANDLSVDQFKVIVAEIGAADAEPGDRWPPIINLNTEYAFEKGSFTLRDGFQGELVSDIGPKIAGMLAQFDADVIEIVGHTDEQIITPVLQPKSNLDALAIDAIWGRNGVTPDELVPVDNAGLGLARAIAVANVLKRLPALADIKVIPMSAGQLIRPTDELSEGDSGLDDSGRRRIEIRVRRTTPPAD